MSQGNHRRRLPLTRAVLFGLLVLALVVPAAAYSGKSASNASSTELEVFSWWTGGGEAAGLTKVIGIWNKEHSNIKFINAAVAGGAGTNAKAVLAQRLAAKDPPDSFQGHAGAELQDYIKAGQLEAAAQEVGRDGAHARGVDDVGSRGAYYDTAGVIRDMFQNHLLQLLMITAMEAPVRFEADAVRDEQIVGVHAGVGHLLAAVGRRALVVERAGDRHLPAARGLQPPRHAARVA